MALSDGVRWRCGCEPGWSSLTGGAPVPESPSAGPDLSLLVCPLCRGTLQPAADGLACMQCRQAFAVSDGIANLQVAAGFDDDDQTERWACEECTGQHMIEHYMVPLLERLFPSAPRDRLRLLSIGCGVGVDVDALTARGYHCHGIDVGNRAKVWSGRRARGCFTRAAVQRMPFRDGEFDFAFLNCVLPHVGVVGDTQTVAPDYQAQREASVQETIRVVRPGGFIMVSNPNRLCPLDLFHRRNEQSHMPRLHSPGEPFLQSYVDHRRAFVEQGGCRSAQLLPPGNFWGFSANSKSSRYWLGRMLQSSIRHYFDLLSTPALTGLRRTALNPWLVVLVNR